MGGDVHNNVIHSVDEIYAIRTCRGVQLDACLQYLQQWNKATTNTHTSCRSWEWSIANMSDTAVH